MNGTFHWKDGWHFWRNADGSVVMEHRVYTLEEETGKYTKFYTVDTKVHIDPDSWCSIIASVSVNGETSEAWHKALEFHNQPLPEKA